MPTVPDFVDISNSCRKSVPDSSDIEFVTPCLCVIGALESSNRGLVMSEVHARKSPTVQIEFLCVGNNRRPSQKSGMRQENRNAPYSSELSPTIPEDRGYLRCRVFISWQNLGRSGNSKIHDFLGFSRHMKTRLNKLNCNASMMETEDKQDFFAPALVSNQRK